MQVMVKKNFLQCFPVNSIQFLFITNSPELASFAVASGVDRIFLDLEILGKQARQGHLDTVISRHAAADLAVLRDVVPPGRLLVRVNPVHEGTEAEIDRVIRDGADIVMLPMFHGPTEVERFCQAVAGRARTCLLVETVGAMRTLADCVRVLGVDEVHIGLNDLHLELGLRFMFEPLAEGLVDRMVQVLREASVPFGIGGVARVGEGMLPAELLLGEHARLGSTGSILSRTFHRQARTVNEIRAQMDFPAEMARLRLAHAAFATASQAELEVNHHEVTRRVRAIAAMLPPRHRGGFANA
jgi:2-keto-3-deoxy-L-rhamnonate aldolase RhmA